MFSFQMTEFVARNCTPCYSWHTLMWCDGWVGEGALSAFSQVWLNEWPSSVSLGPLPSWETQPLPQRPWWPRAAPGRLTAPRWRCGPSTAARSGDRSDQAGAWRACRTTWFCQRTVRGKRLSEGDKQCKSKKTGKTTGGQEKRETGYIIQRSGHI